MAKVNVKFNDKAFSLRVKQTFQKVKRSKQLQTNIGKFVSDRIKAEAKRGTPLNKRRSFPDLAESTIDIRKRLARLNPTGKPFRPNFSNTTLTGQLLNSIDFEAKVTFVEVKPTGKRRPTIINQAGDREKIVPGVNDTNASLAKDLAKRDFVIFDPEVVASENKIVNRIKAITLKFLRRALKVAELSE